MKTKTTTRLSVDLIPEIYAELKIMAQDSGKSIQKYVNDALEAHIRKDIEEEDEMWGKLAEEASKEGFMSIEESEELLQRMKNA
ncbi:MAG: hypothetical protein OXD45_09550 [Rhodobacteraceae bacterium]|nr:hypothetical protein [Paracoccaceae bacterium]